MRAALSLTAWMIAALPTLAMAQDVSTPADTLRDLSTDRPDKTESPYTVDAGHVQVELDFATYTRDVDRRDGRNTRTHTINVAPINLKYGVRDDTDVQIVFDSYVRQTIDDRIAGTRQRVTGFGDVTVRVKHNLWGNDGGTTAFALMPFVTLPTSSNGVGNDHVEGGIIAPLAIALTERLGLGLMTEVDLVRKQDDGGYTPSFVNSITLGVDVTERMGVYGELFTEQSAERGARFVATADAGITYALSGDAQMDVGANLGLSDAADDIALFVGFTRRF